MRRLLIPLLAVVLLLLLVSSDQGEAKKVIKKGLKQHQVFEAIPTQIEGPPAADDQDDDDEEGGGDDDDEASVEDAEIDTDPDAFDLDYVVNRPEPSEDEAPVPPRTRCDELEDIAEGDLSCEDDAQERSPWKKSRKYKTWKRRPLFIIIIGGLRWDYLTKADWNMTEEKAQSTLKALSWIKKHGTTMSQVVPVFPPYDMPTWTSLATGLYPKNTGVVGDYMYNLNTESLFRKDDPDASLENWWIKGEPIWSVAAKHGRKVSVLNWHDCKLPGKNIENPDDCNPFKPTAKDLSKPAKKKKLVRLFNKAITKIHKFGYDMSILYIDSLKQVAKQYGPNSLEVLQELQDLDSILQGRLSDIKNKKDRAELKLNVLLLSDYGLNGINQTTKVVLDKYLEFNHTQFIIQRGGSCVLVPYALRAGDIMRGFREKLGVANMPGVSAYVREKNLEIPMLDYPLIPDDLNYDGLKWTQDILLIAKPGFEIVIEEDHKKILPPLEDDQGMSGYHPQPPPPYIIPGRDKHKSKETRAREKKEVEMYDFFAHSMKSLGFAWGPDFKPGYVSKPVEIVDLYQVISFLLNIPPNHHDGDWNRVKDMLVISGSPSLVSGMSVLLGSMMSVLLLRYLA